MGFARADGSIHLFEPGGRYLDELVRTDDGWRIAVRVTAQDWLSGHPAARARRRGCAGA